MSDTEARRSVKRIDVFDNAIRNAEVEHGLVIEITKEGAGLLMLKEHSFFRDENNEKCVVIDTSIHLTIFHPDIPLDDSASIKATVIWVDEDYSDDRCKIGVSFIDMDDSQTNYVGKLEKWLSKESNYYFHCELEKY